MESFRGVIDTNVLIDLDVGGLLADLFRLDIVWVIPDLVLAELNHPSPNALLKMGLRALELSSEEVEKIVEFGLQYPNLSVYDRASLVLAMREGAMLITGDRRLRKAAEEQGVRVHGTLWVLDQLVERGIPKQTAAQAIRQMLAGGRRLPIAECKKRLNRWEQR